VREGHAWVYERYLSDTTLLLDQAKAKEEAIGFWQVSDPIPPWQWRMSR
jgi:micrococcal nuclease